MGDRAFTEWFSRICRSTGLTADGWGCATRHKCEIDRTGPAELTYPFLSGAHVPSTHVQFPSTLNDAICFLLFRRPSLNSARIPTASE